MINASAKTITSLIWKVQKTIYALILPPFEDFTGVPVYLKMPYRYYSSCCSFSLRSVYFFDNWSSFSVFFRVPKLKDSSTLCLTVSESFWDTFKHIRVGGSRVNIRYSKFPFACKVHEYSVRSVPMLQISSSFLMCLPHFLNFLFGNFWIDNVQKLYHEFIVVFCSLHFALGLNTIKSTILAESLKAIVTLDWGFMQPLAGLT